jgi:gamma-glutamyl-gamma-aminobutyrate hydrolase PuuD
MNVAPYEEALRKAGLEISYKPSLDGTSGLLLMGGTDVNPDLYGEERQPETDEPDEDRDAIELWLLADALSRNMPVLAICRGMQLMNVFHGGTLTQHLEPVERHRVRSQDKSLPVHSVRIAAGSQLCRVFGATAEVNSRHHQAVKKPGGGLLISAKADDGIIEGIERPDMKFVVGVQWHPEDQPSHAGLFQAFASAVRSSASSSGMTSTPTLTVCSAPPSKTP